MLANMIHAAHHMVHAVHQDAFLALPGPNTYYPLTAFSKKQSTAMSSTEAEVIAAKVALRAVGLGSHTVGQETQHAPSPYEGLLTIG